MQPFKRTNLDEFSSYIPPQKGRSYSQNIGKAYDRPFISEMLRNMKRSLNLLTFREMQVKITMVYYLHPREYHKLESWSMPQFGKKEGTEELHA